MQAKKWKVGGGCRVGILLAGFLGFLMASGTAFAAPVTGTEVYPAEEEGTISDPWKGALPKGDWGISAMTGLGLSHPGTGWAFVVAGSRRILRTTPLTEFANDLHGELQVGPILLFGSTLGIQVPLVVSALARWDFHYDEKITFSALGGLGMSWANLAGLNLWNFYPRFAVAAFYRLTSSFGFRGEISHEHTVVGVSAFF